MTDGNTQSSPSATDGRLLLLDMADNVFGVARPISAGESYRIAGKTVTLDRLAGIGFKVARAPIDKGQTILKYGASIGVASQDIAVGQLVHVHNLQSNYLPNTVVAGTQGEPK